MKFQTNDNLNVREYKIAIKGNLGPLELEIEKEHIFRLNVEEYIEPNTGPPVFIRLPDPKIIVYLGHPVKYLLS